MNSLGLFGGSFDPVHHGHLLLARDALEQLRLDRVIFLPAKISPHKLDQPPSSGADRVALLEAALRGQEGFALDTRELRRDGPSFTVETLREYRHEFPEATLHFLVGDDNLPGLDTWKDSAEIPQLARIVLLSRNPATTSIPGTTPDAGFPVIRRQVEISSSEIRNRIAQGRSIRYMTPPCVCEEIQKRGLYRDG